MRNTLLFLIGCFFIQVQISAQEVEIVEEVEEEQVTVEITDESELLKYFTYKGRKYQKEHLSDNCFLFFDEKAGYYKRFYGIVKGDKVLLPPVFKNESYSSYQTSKIFTLNNIQGVYNWATEKWDIPLQYNELKHLGGGLYKARYNGKYGIIDHNKNIIVDFKWGKINKISGVDNYYLVQDKSGANLYGLLSLFDKKLTIPCEYSSIENDGTSSYFKVKKNNTYNIVDINNNVVFKNWYEELNIPKGGRKYYIVKLNNRMGIIDRNEKIIAPIEYINIASSAYNDGSYLAQNKDGFYGCIGLDGKITMPFKYSNIEKVGYGNTNIIARTNDKCGIVRVNDGMPYEITTCDYDNINSNDKLFIVEKNGKYGMLDKYGNVITEIVYDYIESVFSSNSSYSSSKLFIAKKADKYYFINSNGEQINTTSYKLIKPLATIDRYNSFTNSKDYITVQGEGGKFGVVDVFGKQVVAQEYDDILSIMGSVVVVKLKNKQGLYNILKGKLVIPIEYDNFFLHKDNFMVSKGNVFYKIQLSDTVKLIKQ
jgi:hypothetical protein